MKAKRKLTLVSQSDEYLTYHKESIFRKPNSINSFPCKDISLKSRSVKLMAKGWTSGIQFQAGKQTGAGAHRASNLVITEGYFMAEKVASFPCSAEVNKCMERYLRST
jgi:hypothetical protein